MPPGRLRPQEETVSDVHNPAAWAARQATEGQPAPAGGEEVA